MKWAIREAVDVYFKAKSAFKLGARSIRAGEPVLIFDTIKTATQEVGAQVSYVTGGRGNNRLLSYEGDKTLTFNFEEALLSAEGLAILSGADLIPARNPNLAGAPADAQSIITHTTEKFVVNEADIDYSSENAADPYEKTRNVLKKKGGDDNVWLSKKPYIGQNSSIYVMLLDNAGEMSGAPIEVNLNTDDEATNPAAGTGNTVPPLKNRLYLKKFHKKGTDAGEKFVAFDAAGQPILISTAQGYNEAQFDDKVAHYVSVVSFGIDDDGDPTKNWKEGWGDIDDYIMTLTATSYNNISYNNTVTSSTTFGWLVGQPKAFLEGNQFVYKVNVPSVLKGDTVLIDYYVEYRHNATQVSILPEKFAPYMYVEGSSLVRRASDGTDLPVEFVIPKLKITTALTFTFASTGDPSTFAFNGDAFPDFSKFNPTKKILADIQILDADDNYDEFVDNTSPDPTSYRRYQYDEDTDGAYLWKDPAIVDHANIDYSDTAYDPQKGGPASVNVDTGLLDATGKELSASKNGDIWHAPEA